MIGIRNQYRKYSITRNYHLSSPPVFSGVRVTRSLVVCVCFVIVVCPFILFMLVIVLSVRLRYTDSDYPFDVFKPFFLYFCDRVEINMRGNFFLLFDYI